MLKLHQYFLRSTLWVVIVSFLVTALFAFYFAKQSEIDTTKETLKNILNIASIQQDLNSDYLNKLGKNSRVRVTYIDESGKVLFDNEHKPKEMENHLKRPEIQEAKLKGFGSSVRYSHTLKKD